MVVPRWLRSRLRWIIEETLRCMMGVRRARRVSICCTTMRLARRLWTLNEIAPPIVPTGTMGCFDSKTPREAY